MELAMGLPVVIEGFKDGKARLCYPFKLKNINILNGLLSGIDETDLYNNFKDDNKKAVDNIATLLSLAFKIEDDNELKDLLYAIDKDNFAEIIKDIKRVSGILPKSDSLPRTNVGNKQQPIDWEVAVNVFPVYTSITQDKIPELTLQQFNKTLELIGKRINYEYKTHAMSMVKDPSNFITEKDNPLYSEPEFNDKQHLTMSDLQGLMSMKG